uniref:Uncharacterized protein n=1 Tax=Amphimedon queenslandica TaxID=400682 RepID=A0A1X7V313_AMPQE
MAAESVDIIENFEKDPPEKEPDSVPDSAPEGKEKKKGENETDPKPKESGVRKRIKINLPGIYSTDKTSKKPPVFVTIVSSSLLCCCLCYRLGKKRADKMVVTFAHPRSRPEEEPPAFRRNSDMFSSATMTNRPVHTVTNIMWLELESSSGSSSDNGLHSNV